MDIYSTHYLNGVIRQQTPLDLFLSNLLFPTSLFSEREEIYVDYEQDIPLVTPYVHPMVAGKVVENEGYKTKVLRPAYIKDIRMLTPENQVSRRAGEVFGGSLSMKERLKRDVQKVVRMQHDAYSRKMELMASEVLRTGKAVIEGEGFKSELVDFGRKKSHDIALSGDDAWNSGKAPITDQFEAWAALIKKDSFSGASNVFIVMHPDVWPVFRKQKEVKEMLDIRHGAESSIKLTPGQIELGAEFKGFFGQFPIYTYSGSYTEPNSKQKGEEYIKSGEVLFLSKAVKGVRHFGAILHYDCLKSTDKFISSWDNKEPSRKFFKLEAAPLLVPYDPNATMRIKVIGKQVAAPSTTPTPTPAPSNPTPDPEPTPAKPAPTRRSVRKAVRSEAEPEEVKTETEE